MDTTEQRSTPAPSLRERRRREMTRAIANAAVELFERDGFAATTVDDIAAAAGISRTTFFRYSPGKEAAVLVDDAGFEIDLIAAAESASPNHPSRALENAWAAMTEVFDTDPEGYNRFLRVRRLMNHNPSLLAAGLQRQAELSHRIIHALHERAGLQELDARAVAESFAVMMHLTLDEWVRRIDQGRPGVTLRAAHADVLAAFARVAKEHVS